MKELEDAPKELQDMFAILWENATIPIDCKNEAIHFFLKGFDVAMATGGMKPKRTITEVASNSKGTWIVRSNDGKLFIHGVDRSGVPQWLPYPDPPQE